jgi:hypothetical protein
MDAVMRRLGATARQWRTDRLATVIVPGSADVQASFAPVAKYYGAIVVPCPPRRGNRKGAVEAGVKFCCGRWWRTMTATTAEQAQVSLDRFWSTTGDARLRPPGRYAKAGEHGQKQGQAWPSVAEAAGAEVLMALPTVPYPATIEVERPVDERASVAFRGNRYSVASGMTGMALTLRHRLGTALLEVFSPSGALLVTHHLASAGAGQMVRTAEHRAALEAVVLSQFSTARPCDRKANKPPGRAALDERARLLGPVGHEPSVDMDGLAEVISLAFGGSVQVSA